MAAHHCGFNYDTYYSHEAGRAGFDLDYGRQYARKFRVDLSWLMLGEESEERFYIPVMGYVGAGGDVEPEAEQVPPEGLEQLELPDSAAIASSLVAAPLGFIVRGSSMYPRFADGDILVVDGDRRWSLDTLDNQIALVLYRADDGLRRVVKRIARRRDNLCDLESLDPHVPPIIGVRVIEAAPVRIIIPAIGIRRLGPARP